MQHPFLSLLLLLTAGALYADNPSLPLFIFLGLTTFFLERLHTYSGSRKLFIFFICLTAFAIGKEIFTRAEMTETITSKKATYTAIVDGKAQSVNNLTRVPIRLITRQSPMKTPVSGRIQLSIAGDCSLIEGETITFKSSIKPPRRYKNPGVFDYGTYLHRQNIWGRAFLETCDDLKVLAHEQISWREQLQTHLLDPLKPFETRSILAAMLLGTPGIDRSTKDLLRDAGLSHLIAISGMNFAIMIAIVYFTVSLLTRPFAKIYLKYPRQKIAALAGLLFIVVFLIVADNQPSLFRAGLMAGAVLCAVLFERERDLFHLVILAACTQLFLEPAILFDVSFQLSYLCVLILIFVITRLRSPWAEKLNSLPKLPRYLLELLLITASLQLLLLPLILYQFGSVPLMGLVNNLWAIPVFDFVLIPLSLAYFLAQGFCLPFAPFIAQIWDQATAWFLSAAAAGAHGAKLSSLPAPHFSHVLWLYALIFAWAAGAHRRVKITLLGVLFFSLSLTAYENYFSYAARLVLLDVGQGDSLILQTKNKTVLIDSGGHPYFPVGSQVIAPALRHLWIQKIDVAIITHADLDHYGGLISLMDEIPIGEIWINERPSKEIGYVAMLGKAKELGLPVKQVTEPFVFPLSSQDELHVLTPIPATKRLEEDNDRSLITQWQHCEAIPCAPNTQSFKALFTGDLSRLGETALMQTYGSELQSQLLKVGHHGSKSSSSEAFLATVKAQMAFIGVGENNQFHHPASDTLTRLKNAQMTVYRTDQDGMVTLKINGNDISIEGNHKGYPYHH